MIYLYLIYSIILGIVTGVFTGLFPGIHINMVAVMLVSISFLKDIEPIIPVIFLVAMAITHTFVDYIPSVFLGAPDEDSFLSILPGHNLLMKGKAYDAVIYTLYGGAAAILIILLISPLFIFFLSPIYDYVQRIMPYILILSSIFLIYFEKKSRIWAIIIFIMSGFIGIASMNMPVKQPLLPLLTGLFGVSSLATSLMKKQKIPKQTTSKLKNIKIKLKSIVKSISAALIASPLVSFLPGLGTGQAAVIGSEIAGDLNQKEFLVLLGAINTIVMGLSFITLYAVGKTRTGTAVAISQLIELTKLSDLVKIIIVIVIAGIAAFFITLILAKFFAKQIHKIEYKHLACAIIIILVILTLIFSGILGFIILLVSSLTGLTCILLGIRRTHMMGCLLLPTILYYLL